jgi:cytochrome c biogenesis protein CcmG/thiol:disulfide interchange protein DsbE
MSSNQPTATADQPSRPAQSVPEAPSEPRARARTRWLWVLVVAVVVVGLSALFGFGLTRDPGTLRSRLVGFRAPDFSLPTLEGGRTIRLSDFRGSVVVINFWASWCAACREEHPNLLAAWQRYQDHGVVFVGIDYQDSAVAAKAYVRELGGDWPIVTDLGGRTALAYGVYGVPETFFIGPDGIIRHTQVGASSYELLTTQIDRLLSLRGEGS